MSIEHTYKICEETITKVLTKAKAIRAKCLDCSSGYQGEVSKCTMPYCPLFPFRFGNEKGLERTEHLQEGYVDPEKETYDDEKAVEVEDEIDDEMDEDDGKEEQKEEPKPIKRRRIRKK